MTIRTIPQATKPAQKPGPHAFLMGPQEGAGTG